MSKRKGGAGQAQAQDAAHAKANTNEEILKRVLDLYTDPQKGIIPTAAKLDMHILTPRKKVNILIVGNHSSGKSSFINWYVGEDILKTGVAMETQGFNFVSSGTKRETLKGDATLELFKRFEGLRQFKGVVESITTEISTSKMRKFPMLTLIDSPGLVDGNMVYPFDVEGTIKWLAERVDRVFVFLDPMGQALCSRTMNIVAHMNRVHPDKIRFYCTKMDTVEREEDRQKVLIQITQNLTTHIQHRAALTLPTIYIPRDDRPDLPTNGIEDMCKDIEKVIDATIQDTIRTLETDAEAVVKRIDTTLAENMTQRRANMRSVIRGLSFDTLLLLLAAVVGVFFIAEWGLINSLTEQLSEDGPGGYLRTFLHVIGKISDIVPNEWGMYVFGFAAVLGLFIFVVARISWRRKPTLTTADIKFFKQQRELLQEHVLVVSKELYNRYFGQMIDKKDL